MKAATYQAWALTLLAGLLCILGVGLGAWQWMVHADPVAGAACAAGCIFAAASLKPLP